MARLRAGARCDSGCATAHDRAGPGLRTDVARWCTRDAWRVSRQGRGRHLHLHLLPRYLPPAHGQDGAGAGRSGSYVRHEGRLRVHHRGSSARYARGAEAVRADLGANLAGWSFLTGDTADISEVERRYGVFAASAPDGNIDHTFLTSLVDPQGNLRVQYLGVRFDPEEFRRDLLSLL